MKKIIWILALVALVVGCRPTKDIINTSSTQATALVQKDSVYIYQHDSVFIHSKGDTVFVNRFKTYYKDRVKLKSDSVFIQKTAYINRKMIITKTLKSKPKEITVRGFFWWLGLIFSAYILLFSIIKIKNKFRLWQQ